MDIDNTYLPSQFFPFNSIFVFNLIDISLHNVPFTLPFLMSLFVLIISRIPVYFIKAIKHMFMMYNQMVKVIHRMAKWTIMLKNEGWLVFVRK